MTSRSSLPRIGRVFVDTSAFYARSNRRDADFSDAQVIQRRLIVDRAVWFTSNYVVAETHALLLARAGVRAAMAFLHELRQSSIAVVRATEEDDERAFAILRLYDDKDFSLTDATSFAIMDRLGIRHAFTFDRHFAQYGLETRSA